MSVNVTFTVVEGFVLDNEEIKELESRGIDVFEDIYLGLDIVPKQSETEFIVGKKIFETTDYYSRDERDYESYTCGKPFNIIEQQMGAWDLNKDINLHFIRFVG